MPKRYSKRSSKRRSKRSAAATANKALAIAKKTQRRVELKHWDQVENTTTILDDGTVPTALCSPVQGDAPNQRDGDSVFVTSVDIRGSILMASLDIVRVVVYTWNAGASTLPSDVFQNTNSATAVFTHKDWDGRFRSNFLLDKVICPLGYDSNTNREVPFHFRVKGMNHRVRMANGGIVPENGQIYIVFMSNQAVSAEAPTVSWRSRVIFKDL